MQHFVCFICRDYRHQCTNAEKIRKSQYWVVLVETLIWVHRNYIISINFRIKLLIVTVFCLSFCGNAYKSFGDQLLWVEMQWKKQFLQWKCYTHIHTHIVWLVPHEITWLHLNKWRGELKMALDWNCSALLQCNVFVITLVVRYTAYIFEWIGYVTMQLDTLRANSRWAFD